MYEKGILPPQPEINIHALERTLNISSLTNSYKIFWFDAILDEVQRERPEIPFPDLAISMIIKCWYIVLRFRLDLGKQDQCCKVIQKLRDTYEIPETLHPDQLRERLCSLSACEKERILSTLYRYVPYRFLSPFYEEELKGVSEAKKNRIIEKKSVLSPLSIYAVNSSDSKITIGYKWYEYLYCNYPILKGWCRFKLVEYLQSRNPNAPSIIDKITPPLERDLSKARDFWKKIITVSKVEDIYICKKINPEEMSIDHFVPWSFVLHDRLWNLVPVHKEVNSSKNDALPSLDLFFDRFASLQYRTFKTAIKHNIGKSVMEDYLLLGKGIELSADIGEERFKEILKNTITPLHTIALNQGFSLWSGYGGSTKSS